MNIKRNHKYRETRTTTNHTISFKNAWFPIAIFGVFALFVIIWMIGAVTNRSVIEPLTNEPRESLINEPTDSVTISGDEPVFNNLDWTAYPIYSTISELTKAIEAARDECAARVAFSLAPPLDDKSLVSVFARFNGKFDYTYGKTAGTDVTRVLVSITYTPGKRVATAFRTGDTSPLTTRETELLNLAASILSAEFMNASPLVQERAIHDGLCAGARYYDKPANGTQETLPDYDNALGLMLDGRGNCMAYADAFEMMAAMAGFNVETVFGEALSSANVWTAHAWNNIELNGKWYAVDVTYDDLDSDPFICDYAYFNIGADEMSATHRLNDGMTPSESVSPFGAYSGAFVDAVEVVSMDELDDTLEASAASADATFIRTNGFIVEPDYVNNFIAGLRLPYGMLSINRVVGANQYWSITRFE